LGHFRFLSFTYRATFTPRIRNQPSTRVHGRPGIGMKQKKIQAIVVSSDSDCYVSRRKKKGIHANSTIRKTTIISHELLIYFQNKSSFL